MPDKINILIVDDHIVVRQGIAAMIRQMPDLEIVGEAVDGIDAIEKTRQLSPDVILMDLIMPRMDGLQAIIEIKKFSPDAKILVITSFSEDDQVLPAIQAGALGYVLKAATSRELVKAIRDVYQGDAPLDPTIARRLLNTMAKNQDDVLEPDLLTEREIQVLRLIAKGLSNEDIAEKLFISDGTVRSHVTRILNKLGLTNRTQAALYALKQGIISLYSEE